MSNIKNLVIDSLNPLDVNDMFEAICMDILHITPAQGKRTILKLTGTDAVIAKYKAKITDLVNVISLYDIPLELKLSYATAKKYEKTGKMVFDEGFVKDDIITQLDKQEAEIKNKALLEGVKKPGVIVHDKGVVEPALPPNLEIPKLEF